MRLMTGSTERILRAHGVKLPATYIAGIFMTNWEADSFSRRPLLHVVRKL
jgi:hypothetical protein